MCLLVALLSVMPPYQFIAAPVLPKFVRDASQLVAELDKLRSSGNLTDLVFTSRELVTKFAVHKIIVSSRAMNWASTELKLTPTTKEVQIPLKSGPLHNLIKYLYTGSNDSVSST